MNRTEGAKRNNTKTRSRKRKRTAFYTKRPFLIFCGVLAVAVVVFVIIIASSGSAKRPKSTLTREQQLMEMVRSKNVIPCHISSINNFFFIYYGALASGDTSVLEDSFDNPKLANISANISTMVSRISDIKVYVTPGIKKNEIAAYVKYNIYFKNISTPVPSVDSFYIHMNTSDSSIHILTKMYSDQEINEFLTLVSFREPVRSLLSDTETEMQDILNSNTELRNIYVVMSSMTDENEGGR